MGITNSNDGTINPMIQPSLSQPLNISPKKKRQKEPKKMVQKRHPCDKCAKSFDFKSSLKSHQAIVHEGAPKFSCELCDKIFSKSCDLRRHTENIHQGLNRIQCDFCSKSLTRLDNLNAHIKRCHKDLVKIETISPTPKKSKLQKVKTKSKVHEKPKNHICPTCSKTFLKASYLKKHMSRLHDEERNKFKCDLCENEYTDKKSMLRHRDHFHFGQKFTCELCGKDFGQISALKTHVSSVHEKKHYACDICYKVFAYRSTVIEHMKIDHEGAAKNYKCEQCEKA